VSEVRAAWSPDGTRIAFWRFNENVDSIVVINADGTGERTLTGPREHVADPAWSPDGEWIAYTRETDNLDSPEIWVMRSDGSQKRKLVKGPFRPSDRARLDRNDGTLEASEVREK
jgi:TolB protein